MNPDLAKKLVESEQGRELVRFLASECLKLDTLEGVSQDNAYEVAIEVKARKRALETVKRILDPLVSAKDYRPGGVSGGEYVV